MVYDKLSRWSISFKDVTILAIFCLLKNECYLHGKFDIEGKKWYQSSINDSENGYKLYVFVILFTFSVFSLVRVNK